MSQVEIKAVVAHHTETPAWWLDCAKFPWRIYVNAKTPEKNFSFVKASSTKPDTDDIVLAIFDAMKANV